MVFRGGAQKDQRKEMKMEAGYRARAHLSGCGVHANPRKFEEISESGTRSTQKIEKENETEANYRGSRCALLNSFVI